MDMAPQRVASKGSNECCWAYFDDHKVVAWEGIEYKVVMDGIKTEPEGASGANGSINAMVGALQQIGLTMADLVTIEHHHGQASSSRRVCRLG